MTEENTLAAPAAAPAAEPPSKPLLSWQTATAIATASVGVGAVLLHAIGSIRHNVFLAQFGMDADLFPKSADWLMLYGFYGVFNRANWGLIFLRQHWYWLPVVWIALGLYLFVLKTPVGEGEPGPFTLWLKRKGAWAKRLLLSLILSWLAVWVSIVALLLVWLATVFIGVVGETAGLATAEMAKEDYAKGCEKSKSKCVVLLKGGQTVASGYVLDSSVSHIAIFDPEERDARSLPREGTEVIWKTRATSND